MPYSSNTEWLPTDFKEQDPIENYYFQVDNPFGTRPDGVTKYIGYHSEPFAVSNYFSGFDMKDAFLKNYSKYDLLLTWHPDLLKGCPNAVYYMPANTWLSPGDYNNIDISRKLPKISSLTGCKSFCEGHNFRRHLYFSQTSINLPIDWYRSGQHEIIPEVTNNPLIDGSLPNKIKLFLEYQYSVVIENSRQDGYFTEKLLDCLISKTIPIYWGCPNINQWFDTTGWIILNETTVEELVSKCSNLPDYINHLPSINSNYEIAKKYASHKLNIGSVLGLE